MIVRQRIWEELRLAKVSIICLQRYTDKSRKKSRIFNSLIILFASTGAISGAFEQWDISIVASSLVALSTILKTLLPNFLNSEKELSDLDRLMDFYSVYFNDLERVWYSNENRSNEEDSYSTESEIMERFFILKENESDKFSSLNRGIRTISKKEMEAINNETREYVNRVYFDYGDAVGKS